MLLFIMFFPLVSTHSFCSLCRGECRNF